MCKEGLWGQFQGHMGVRGGNSRGTWGARGQYQGHTGREGAIPGAHRVAFRISFVTIENRALPKTPPMAPQLTPPIALQWPLSQGGTHYGGAGWWGAGRGAVTPHPCSGPLFSLQSWSVTEPLTSSPAGPTRCPTPQSTSPAPGFCPGTGKVATWGWPLVRLRCPVLLGAHRTWAAAAICSPWALGRSEQL